MFDFLKKIFAKKEKEVVVTEKVSEIVYPDATISMPAVQGLEKRDFTQPYVANNEEQKTKISIYVGNPFRNKNKIEPLIIIPKWMQKRKDQENNLSK